MVAYALQRKQLPSIYEILHVDSFDHITDSKVMYSIVQLLIKSFSFAQKQSADFVLALIIRNLPEALALAAMTEFCLVKLDNKYFKIH